MDKNIYNLYITFGTLPALYSQLNIFLDNTPSYVWVRSGGAFIPDEYFPSNLKFYKKFDGFNDIDFFETQYKDISEEINNIIKNEPNIKFNVFCDDSRIQFLLKIFMHSNLDSHINKTIIISEGNITEYMSRNVSPDYFELTKSKWENLLNLIRKPKANLKEINEKLSLIDNYSFYLATLNNYKYLIPNLNLLLSQTKLGNIKINMNLLELNFVDIYKNLPKNISEQFIKNALYNQEIKKIFENQKNNILIINGTYNFLDEKINNFIYSDLINKIIDDYGKNYILFYKAHPLFPVDKNLSFFNFLNQNNVIILPEKIPLELILWEYENVKVGGFCSTIHSLINKNQVKFIFGDLNGFAKYIFKDDFNNYYNLKISQDLASLSLKYYYDIAHFINRFDNAENNLNNIINKFENMHNKLNNIENKIEKIENKIEKIENNIKNINSKINIMETYNINEINSLKKYIKIIKIPIYPFIWLKRKILKLKEKNK